MIFVFRLLIFCLFFAAIAACRTSGGAENSNQNANAPTIPKISIPFSVQEPENFQTEIVITSQTANEKNERRYLLARKGSQRLMIFGRGGERETGILQTSDGQNLLLDYAAKTAKKAQNNAASGSDLTAFLTTEYLSRKTDANFEKVGTENNLTVYRSRTDDANATEILIGVDENLKLPVKQEFFSVNGEQKTLLYAVELKNFNPKADENSFVVPKGFRIVE